MVGGSVKPGHCATSVPLPRIAYSDSSKTPTESGMPINAKRRLAQHFLEPQWVKKLVKLIDPRDGEQFLEIGSGRGALTLAIAESGARITAVEVDPTLATELAATAPASVSVLTADFLGLDLHNLKLPGSTRVVGNLPYNLSAPILLKLLQFSSHGARLTDAILTVQLEVADRITGLPGSRNWGPLAIATQLHASPQRVLNLPPGAFRPMPKVRSAAVSLRFRRSQVRIHNRILFDSLVRALFTQRRKTTLNALKPFINQLSTLPPLEIFHRAGADPKGRPGDLKLSELADLTEVLASGQK